jgi:hypothetical protein
MELITRVKPNINLVKVHPQLSDNGHPVDGALVAAGWFTLAAAGPVKVPVQPQFTLGL